MKLFKYISLFGIILATGLAARAEDAKPAETKPTPDKLTTCPVSGEMLGGDMGKPVVFIYKNQEVKLCCKSCKKDFDKDPDKYLVKIRAADKTDKK